MAIGQRFRRIYVIIESIASTVKFLLKSGMDLLYSTTTPLGAAGGGSETVLSNRFDVREYRRLCGTCFANKNGTLKVWLSSDNTNDDGEHSYTYTANDKLTFDVPASARYARVRFENTEGSAQTVFRLYFEGKY